MGRLTFDPTLALAGQAGGEDLTALGVEHDEQFGGVRRGILRQDLNCRHGDDFRTRRESKSLGQGDSDAQAGERAGTDGNVEFLEIGRAAPAGFAELIDLHDKLRRVLEAVRKLVLGDDPAVLEDGDGADPARSFDRQGAVHREMVRQEKRAT